MPARAATRATAGSPSVCIIRVNPVGAKPRGEPAGRPRIVVDVSTRGDVLEHVRVELQPGVRMPGTAQADLVAGSTVGVVEHRSWRAAPGQQSQVEDGCGAGQPPLGGIEGHGARTQQRRQLGPARPVSGTHPRVLHDVLHGRKDTSETGLTRTATATRAHVGARHRLANHPGRRGATPGPPGPTRDNGADGHPCGARPPGAGVPAAFRPARPPGDGTPGTSADRPALPLSEPIPEDRSGGLDVLVEPEHVVRVVLSA